MDVVYTFRQNPFEALRWPGLIHSINSIRKNMIDVGDIYIASQLRPLVLGITGVKWVPIRESAPTTANEREQNIIYAIREASVLDALSADFLWMQDDSYAIKQFSGDVAKSFRHVGKLSEQVNDSSFGELIKSTKEKIGDLYCCCAHTPVVFSKEKFLRFVSKSSGLQIETGYAYYTHAKIIDNDKLCSALTAECDTVLDQSVFFNVAEGMMNPEFIRYALGFLYPGEIENAA